MWWLAWLACQDPLPDSPVTVDSEPTADSQVEPLQFESAIRCAECHPQQYEEWQTSMHAYAARSPVFDAMAGKAHRDSGAQVGTFCTGCHSVVGTEAGEPGSFTTEDRSDLSNEGVTCDVCHSAVDHGSPIGNATLRYDTSLTLGPYASEYTEGHMSVQSDFTTSSRLCGSCHDVFSFPALEIEQAFAEYIASPAAQEGTRCQDCHMSPTPGITGGRSWGPSAVVEGQNYPDRELATHRFIGPDYSLVDDFPYPDDLQASAQAQAWTLGQIQILLENAVELDGLQLYRNGSAVRVSVALRSLTPGHRVPTGFTSERQLWVEVVATRPDGSEVYRSGDLDTNGDLRDEHSALVQSGTVSPDRDLVNLQSRNMVRVQEEGFTEVYETVFPFDANYIERRSLKPLERRELEYRFEEDGPVEVSVLLHYRNLPPYLLRALQVEELVERLVIFTIDEESASIP